MRYDITKVICERQRHLSREGSLRTARKLDVKLDWESDDFDWGPTHMSSARRRQEGQGRYHKGLNHNSNALSQFLGRNIGHPWDEVYSDICKASDIRSFAGWNLRRTLLWLVETNIALDNGKPYSCSWSRHEYNGYYVHPETGILCENVRKPYVRQKDPATTLHWHDNVWFVLQKYERPASCGCVHFRPPKVDLTDTNRWMQRFDLPMVCMHGNEPSYESIWHVIEYSYHDPNDVYQTYYYETSNDYYRRIYDLKAPGDKHIRYYRDVPDILKTPIETKKKTANRNELRLIQEILAEPEE